jgi:hypothetical protein
LTTLSNAVDAVAGGTLRPGRLVLVGVLAAVAAGVVVMLAMVFSTLQFSLSAGADGAGEPGGGDGASVLAQQEIPARYLDLYEEAGRRYRVDWAILAGIGRVECDHGRDPDPSCTKEGAVNSAGAGGPMQFLASTWARYGVDGDDDGLIDRWNPADAIPSAANYLRASGAPGDYRGALFAYNHAVSYVREVEHWAALYRAPAGSQPPLARAESGEQEGADRGLEAETPTTVRFIPGERASLTPGDGHLAMIPSGVPARVQAMVVAGNELQELPYGPGGHPDPRGAFEEDCSSTVNYVLYRSGVRGIAEIVRDNPLAQEYVRWGAPGPGRWVTIYATTSPTPHVFIVVAGLRLDTSHNGTDIGPNRGEDGPRWRILDHIPTWAHWSVRHPPGM